MQMNHKIDDATTPEEMRAALFRALRYSSIVHHAFTTADIKGLNGEDRYTLLAYHAVKLAEGLQESLFEQALTQIRPTVVHTKTKP